MVNARALTGAPWAEEAARLAGVGTAGLGWPRYLFFLNWSEKVHGSYLHNFECINFHCARLPYGRGGGPIENLILRGHTETVITAHRMTSELDAGPIYCVSEPIGLAGTKDDITARFVEPVAKMMRYIMEHNPEPRPQVGEPTYFKRLSPEAYQQFWASRG